MLTAEELSRISNVVSPIGNRRGALAHRLSPPQSNQADWPTLNRWSSKALLTRSRKEGEALICLFYTHRQSRRHGNFLHPSLESALRRRPASCCSPVIKKYFRWTYIFCE